MNNILKTKTFHVEHSVFGIYVHVPFCVSRCGYCDFCRVTDYGALGGYLSALRAEVSRSPCAGLAPRTVYFGGGTPSSVGRGTVAELLALVAVAFDLRGVVEYTFECNPDDVDGGLAETLMAGGVNRVSMGAQSLCDDALRMMGRRHSAEQVRRAVGVLRGVGFRNVSVDCIFGLPGVRGYSARRDFEAFAALGVEHLSAYALSYEPGSRFSKMVAGGGLVPLPDDAVAEQYGELCDVLRGAGYSHYEISSFAKPGLEAVHNSSYWSRTPYFGFGPSASSFCGNVRTTNTMDVGEYVATAGDAKSLCEELTAEEEYEEVVMLGLRTSGGVSLADVPPRFRGLFARRAAAEVENGNLTRSGDVYAIPEGRWFVADGIIGRLFA